jgi:hypothetical protein
MTPAPLAMLTRSGADLVPDFRQLLLAATAVFWSLNYIAVSWCIVGRMRATKCNRLAAN